MADETVLLEDVGIILTEREARLALAGLPLVQRQKLTANPRALGEFVFELFAEKHMAQEAEQAELAQDEVVQAQIERARRQVLVKALQEHHKTSLDYPDFDQLARDYYLANKTAFTRPARVKVAHILLKERRNCPCDEGNKERLAEQLLTRLQEGESFETLAQEYSEDKISVRRGGELGWSDKNDFVPPFAAAAFALPEPGAISEVVKTRYGYHIIKLLDREEPELQGFAEVEDKIMYRLQQDYLKQAMQDFNDRFFPGTTAHINKEAILALDESTPEVAQ